jgi:S1-C subfamily serine protease
VAPDGVVATHADVMARAGERRWLWARSSDGPWERVVPLGSVAWADVGLGRVVSLRRRRPTVRWRGATREDLGAPLVSVGTPWGRWPVVSSARLDVRTLLHDASRTLVDERRQRMLGSEVDGAAVLELAGEPGLSATGALGAPVFAADGACLGLVAAVREDGTVRVRSADVLRPVIDNVARHGAFTPPTIGARLAGVGPPEAAGVLVQHVTVPGPSNGVLWEGDIVIGLGGRAVLGREPATTGLALLGLEPDVPASVVVWRGGKPKGLSLTPRAASPPPPASR